MIREGARSGGRAFVGCLMFVVLAFAFLFAVSVLLMVVGAF